MTQEPGPYDALLLVSFGGPEAPEEVIPFLQNVTRGRNIPRERLDEVAEHYLALGGRSPINDQNRALLSAIRQDFADNGLGDVALYWGNRNWSPYLTETFAQMKSAGVSRVACLLTSAYSSYSGCRQYRENLAEAAAAAGQGAPRVDRLRHYFNHPGFVETNADATLTAVAALPEAVRDEARLLFVTHSIPTAMNQVSGPEGEAYTRQHRSVAELVTERVRSATGRPHVGELVFCSRSGPPQVPWLEPDVNDRIEQLATEGGKAVVLVPIGFVSDHMEVIYDLDTEAAATAEQQGVALSRAATVGVDPRFVAMVRDLFVERSQRESGAGPTTGLALGTEPASWDVCPVGCCANARGPKPALAGSD